MTNAENNNICVVIPVKNEAKGIERLILSILAQKPKPDEVVVVDAGSTDETLQIIKGLSKGYPELRVISKPGALPGDGRNAGIGGTTEDIIVQIDGSCLVTKDWLKELTQPLFKGKGDYVTGRILPMPEIRFILNRPIDMGNIFSASINPVLRSSNTIAGGASVAYRRRLWELAGGQPEWLRCGEDAVFVAKLKAVGITPVYADKSLAFWQIGPALSDIFRRKIRYSESTLLLDTGCPIKNAALIRLFLMILLLLLSMFSSLFLFLFFLMIFTIIAKRTVQSIKRYQSRNHDPGSSSLFLVRLLILRTEIVLFTAQQIGLVRGISARLRKKDNADMLKRYLQV